MRESEKHRGLDWVEAEGLDTSFELGFGHLEAALGYLIGWFLFGQGYFASRYSSFTLTQWSSMAFMHKFNYFFVLVLIIGI